MNEITIEQARRELDGIVERLALEPGKDALATILAELDRVTAEFRRERRSRVVALLDSGRAEWSEDLRAKYSQMSSASVEARIRAAVFVDGVHHYLSTYCVHPDKPEQHAICRLESKCCAAPCVCSCHAEAIGRGGK